MTESVTTGPVGSEPEMRALVDSGDLIAFGPPGEPARLTMQRTAKGYVVKSGHGRQSFSVATWDEACAAPARIVGAA